MVDCQINGFIKVTQWVGGKPELKACILEIAAI